MATFKVRLVTDTMLQFRPLDGYNSLDEDLELERNCNTGWYKRGKTLLDLFLKISSLKLEAELRDHNFLREKEVVSYRFKVADGSSEPPEVLRKSSLLSAFWQSRYSRPVCRLILGYLLLKYGLISVLTYKRDSILKYWRPILSPDAERNDFCTVPKKLARLDVAKEALRAQIESLNLLGNLYIAETGLVPLMFQAILSMTLLIYFFGQFQVHLWEPRCDHINLTMHPHVERQRIRLELDKIVACLSDRMLDQAAIAGIRQSTRFSVIELLPARIRRRIDADEFLKMLRDVVHLVKPANLTPKWHLILVYISNLSIISLLGSIFMGNGSVVSNLILDCIERAKHRLAMIECQKWRPDGVLIKDRFSLRQLESAADLEAYLSHDGSVLNLWKLGLFVESKYMIRRPEEWLFLIESQALMLFAVIPFSTYLFVYVWSLPHRIKWMNQVDEQLRVDANLCNYLDNHEAPNEKELVKCLTISYLNYRLYQGQLKPYLAMAHTFIPPMLLLALHLMIVSYLVATQTNLRLSQIVLVEFLYFAIQINLYLATCSLLFAKSQKMMCNILKLVVRARGGSPSRRIIVDLWRRQLVNNRQQLEQLSAVHIFGRPVSFGLQVTLNFYLLLLCIILARA